MLAQEMKGTSKEDAGVARDSVSELLNVSFKINILIFLILEERKWCADKSLDVNILRETALMVDEVKVRFLRMNIPIQCLNSRVRVGVDYPDGELILKTCIGGAFYSKYIKP